VDGAEYTAERARIEAAIKRNRKASDDLEARQTRPDGQTTIKRATAAETISLEREYAGLTKELADLNGRWREMEPPKP
jgi:hypothetical protein